MPIEGSVALFLAGIALHLFATTSLGIFMATLARSMPQFGMLAVLILLPLQLLSGGFTPRESMPVLVQKVMLAAPTTHFVSLGQAILFRGAGLDVVWPQFLALAVIGSALFLDLAQPLPPDHQPDGLMPHRHRSSPRHHGCPRVHYATDS